eukprot:1521823-Rhodomonas_salina.1
MGGGRYAAMSQAASSIRKSSYPSIGFPSWYLSSPHPPPSAHGAAAQMSSAERAGDGGGEELGGAEGPTKRARGA